MNTLKVVNKNAKIIELNNSDDEFNERLEGAKLDVLDRVYECNDPFSYDDIENIMLDHGLEMDYIHDILF